MWHRQSGDFDDLAPLDHVELVDDAGIDAVIAETWSTCEPPAWIVSSGTPVDFIGLRPTLDNVRPAASVDEVVPDAGRDVLRASASPDDVVAPPARMVSVAQPRVSYSEDPIGAR